MTVSLTPSEIMQGALVGVMRQTQNLKKHRRPAYGSGTSNDWQIHIEGALGEFAVAKALGKFWSGNLGQLKLPDVGTLEVRTRSRHDYDLILHEDDADSSMFVLVTGVNGEYILRGWMLGKHGKKDKYWKDPAGGRPAFFIPQADLRPIENLLP